MGKIVYYTLAGALVAFCLFVLASAVVVIGRGIFW